MIAESQRAPRSPVRDQSVHDPVTVVLEGVLRSTRACHASALRFAADGSRLVVAAVAGMELLSPGMELPPDDLDAALAGAEDTLTVPLRREDGHVEGFLHVAWPEARSAPANRTAFGTADWHVRDLTRVLLCPDPRLGRAVVAHEDELVADGVARRLERQWTLTVETCSCPSSLQQAVAQDVPADVVLLSDALAPDLALPELVAPVRATCPEARVVVLTRTATPFSLRQAQAAAAEGVVALDEGAPELLRVVEAISRGETAVPPAPAVPDRGLSRRERQILDGLDEGLTYQEIATRLGVSLSTVKTQSRSLFRKLDVTSRGAAVHRARIEGLI